MPFGVKNQLGKPVLESITSMIERRDAAMAASNRLASLGKTADREYHVAVQTQMDADVEIKERQAVLRTFEPPREQMDAIEHFAAISRERWYEALDELYLAPKVNVYDRELTEEEFAHLFDGAEDADAEREWQDRQVQTAQHEGHIEYRLTERPNPYERDAKDYRAVCCRCNWASRWLGSQAGAQTHLERHVGTEAVEPSPWVEDGAMVLAAAEHSDAASYEERS